MGDVSWAVNVLFGQLLCDVLVQQALTAVGEQETNLDLVCSVVTQLDVGHSLEPRSRLLEDLVSGSRWCVCRRSVLVLNW